MLSLSKLTDFKASAKSGGFFSDKPSSAYGLS